MRTAAMDPAPDFDQRLLREYYSLPFQMAFRDGGASSYMASYNAWNAVPMTVNPILKDMVAGEWGVDGIVSTDAGAVHNMVNKHRYFPDMRQAVAACVKIGVNQFLDGYQEAGCVKPSNRKAASEQDIDAALRGKFRGGSTPRPVGPCKLWLPTTGLHRTKNRGRLRRTRPSRFRWLAKVWFY